MALSRKDYINIAKCIRNARISDTARREIVWHTAGYIKSVTPLFDAEKFYHIALANSKEPVRYQGDEKNEVLDSN